MIVHQNNFGLVSVVYDPPTFPYIPPDIERKEAPFVDEFKEHFALVNVESPKGTVLYRRSVQKGNTSKIRYRYPWHFERITRSAEERLKSRILDSILWLERYSLRQKEETQQIANCLDYSQYFSDALKILEGRD